MKTVDDMELIRSFNSLALSGSLPDSAQNLKISRSTLSRRIKELENKVGADLFVRDHSGFRLTVSGFDLLQSSNELLKEFNELNNFVKDSPSEDGCLHISCPSAIGNGLLIGWLKEFMELHPLLMVDLTLTLGPVRLLDNKCDIRINHGLFPCERVISRPLGNMLRMMVASPEYLSKNGSVDKPEDLNHHSLLAGNDMVGKGKLVLSNSGETITIPYFPKLHLKDHNAARTAALNHIGIAVHAFKYDTLPFVQSGQLIEVLPGWEPETSPVSVLLPANKPAHSITNEFVDFLVNKWISHPYLSSSQL